MPLSRAAVRTSGTSYGFGCSVQVSVPYAPKLDAPFRSLLVIGTATICFGSKIVRIVSARPLMVSTVATSATVAAAESPFSQPLTAAGAARCRGRPRGRPDALALDARAQSRERAVRVHLWLWNRKHVLYVTHFFVTSLRNASSARRSSVPILDCRRPSAAASSS